MAIEGFVENEENSYCRRENIEGDSALSNYLIFGDNLPVLRKLAQTLSNKVKCIYIDPPYNTGRSFVQYEDNVEHLKWLAQLRERLEVLWSLLSEDGVLWVNLNDEEGHYVKVLMDELFGRDKFRAWITWQRKYSVSNNSKGIAPVCDYLVVFAKKKFVNNLLPRSQALIDRYSNPDNDPRGLWQSVEYWNQATPEQRKNLCYDITNPNTQVVIKNTKRAWKYSLETHRVHVLENRIWWGKDGKSSAPRLKVFLSEIKDGMIPSNFWKYDEVGHTDEASKEQKTLFPNSPFETPKPERLLKRIIELSTNQGDIVLDAFAGSGTTGAVAHKMGRKWIMIEQGEQCHTHIIPRMKKVIDGRDVGGVSESVHWTGGGGFHYLTELK